MISPVSKIKTFLSSAKEGIHYLSSKFKVKTVFLIVSIVEGIQYFSSVTEVKTVSPISNLRMTLHNSIFLLYIQSKDGFCFLVSKDGFSYLESFVKGIRNFTSV